MDIILFLAVGLVAGVVARRIVPWRRPDTMGTSMAVGIIGAFAGAFVGRLLGYQEGAPAVFVTSALGAITLVVLYHAVGSRRTTA